MKKIVKRLLAMTVSFVMLFTMTTGTFAINETTVTNEEQILINEIMSYWAMSKEETNEHKGPTLTSIPAVVDIERCIGELKAINPELGSAYDNIMSNWLYADTSMDINMGVLPDGLPDDESLCIITLGFQLDQQTGEMQPELIDRLEVTLASANKYPNATIAVTGGGTSPADPTKTEGRLMGDWLIANGIDESRIIVEDSAATTVENALNTFKFLKTRPELTKVAMISSESHVQRGVAIFDAVFRLEAYKAKTSNIEIISNAACEVERVESFKQQLNSVTEAMSRTMGVDFKYDEAVKLSTLEGITLTNVKDTYYIGDVVKPIVMAKFLTSDNQVFELDVTEFTNISKIDTSKEGTISIEANYTYNDIMKNAIKNIKIIAKPADKPVEPTKPDKEAVAVKTGDETMLGSLVMLSLLSIGGYLTLRKES